MNTLLQDVRFGARMLRKSPGSTLVALAALALGIGANTAMFSVINAALLRPLPLDDPDHLVMVWATNLQRGWPQFPLSVPDFLDLRQQSQTLEAVSAYQSSSMNLSGNGPARRLSTSQVTADFFTALRERPVLGRTFTNEEMQPGRDRVAVLSHALWQEQFAGDRGVMGRSITLNGLNYIVIGVMGPRFQFPEKQALWTPFAFSADDLALRGAHSSIGVARLKPGVKLEQARTEVTSLATRLEKQYPATNAGFSIAVEAAHEAAVKDARPLMLLIQGAVCVVLLIACANIANLLLARGAARRKEVAVRIALGAGRGRLVRQFLAESVTLALVGGTIGLLPALWATDLMRGAGMGDVPNVDRMTVDWRCLAFTIAVSLATGVLFGLAPALEVSRGDLNATLRTANRVLSNWGRGGSRGFFVVAEVALSLALLATSGLLLRSFYKLRAVDTGFDSSNLLTMQIALSSGRYATPAQQYDYFTRLISRVETLPGVRRATMTSLLPLSGSDQMRGFHLADRPRPSAADAPAASYRAVSPGYFQTLGVRLLRGRLLDERDRAGSERVVVVSEMVVRRYLPNEDPVGKQISMGSGKRGVTYTIVGVVSDVHFQALNQNVDPALYFPLAQETRLEMALVVKTSLPSADLAPAIRGEAQAIDPDQPVYNVQTMQHVVSASLNSERASSLLVGAFAVVALLLAAVGIYGVMSYAVAQRTPEIGIRMALGAQVGDVRRLVVADGMTLVVCGLLIGGVAAYGVARLLSKLLYGVKPGDPATLFATAAILALVALLASYLPARRATRIDPVMALRND